MNGDTPELFFTTPVPRLAFLLGPLLGRHAVPRSLVGLAGILGSLAGSFMPWLDQDRIAAVRLASPTRSVSCSLVLPNLLVFCAPVLQRRRADPFRGADLRCCCWAWWCWTSCSTSDAVPPVPQLAAARGSLRRTAGREAARYWTVTELNTLTAADAAGAEPPAVAGPSRRSCCC